MKEGKRLILTGLLLCAGFTGAIPARRAAGQQPARARSTIRPFFGLGATLQSNAETLERTGVALSGGVNSAADSGGGWEASVWAAHLGARNSANVHYSDMDLVAGMIDAKWSAAVTRSTGVHLRAGVGFYHKWPKPNDTRSNAVGANLGATWMFTGVLGLDAQAHLLSTGLGGTHWFVPLQVRLVM